MEIAANPGGVFEKESTFEDQSKEVLLPNEEVL